MFQHGIHDHEQLAHAGGEGDFCGFALAAQALVKRPNHWIAAHRAHRRHVQRSAHLGAAAPDDPFALMFAAVPVEGRHTRQRGNLLVAQCAQLRQQRQQRDPRDRTDSRDGLEQIVLFTPGARSPQGMGQINVQPGNPFVQPDDMFLETVALDGRGPAQTQFLLHSDVDQLAPARQQVAQGAGVLVGQGAYLGPNGGGEGGQHQGIDAVGLGQSATGLGVIAGLAWIDYRHWQPSRRKCAGQIGFQPAGRFHHDQRGHGLAQPLTEAGDGFFAMGNAVSVAARLPTQIEPVFGNVDADKGFVVAHSGTLPCKNPGLGMPDQLSGLQEHATRRPALTYGLNRPRAQRAAASPTAGVGCPRSTSDSSTESVG